MKTLQNINVATKKGLVMTYDQFPSSVKLCRAINKDGAYYEFPDTNHALFKSLDDLFYVKAEMSYVKEHTKVVTIEGTQWIKLDKLAVPSDSAFTGEVTDEDNSEPEVVKTADDKGGNK